MFEDHRWRGGGIILLSFKMPLERLKEMFYPDPFSHNLSKIYWTIKRAILGD
jgi:hypothetical protein